MCLRGSDGCSRCPEDNTPTPASTELQSIGHAAMRGNPFMQQRPNACSTQSYQVCTLLQKRSSHAIQPNTQTASSRYTKHACCRLSSRLGMPTCILI